MSLLFPNANRFYTSHVSQVNGRGLSPLVWQHIDAGASSPDGVGGGVWFGDDFTGFAGMSAEIGSDLTYPDTAGQTLAGYHAYVDTSGSITRVQTDNLADLGGVVKVIGGDAADDNTAFGTGEYIHYDVATPNQQLTIFEARVRLTTVTDGSAFIGLGSSEMIASAGLIAGSGLPITTANAIGFNVIEDDPDGWDFVYQAAGQTPVRTASLQDAVAATWYKLGFVINPTEIPEKRVKIYVDNVEQSSYVTGTIVEGTAFPADVGLGLVAGSMVETAGTEEKELDIDWWACYQAP